MSLGQADLRPLKVCAGQARGGPAARQSSFSQNQDPGARSELKQLGVGVPPPPGAAAFGSTQPCVLAGWAVVFAATVAVCSARRQTLQSPRLGPAVLEHSISWSGCGVTWSRALTTLSTFLYASCNPHHSAALQIILKVYRVQPSSLPPVSPLTREKHHWGFTTHNPANP